MRKLQNGVWKAKDCDIQYVLVENNKTGDFNAVCIETSRLHLIKRNNCKNFLDNHYCLKDQ